METRPTWTWPAPGWWLTRISVLLNLGEGEMALPVYYETTTSLTAVEVGDLDADGDVDVIVANTGANWNRHGRWMFF
ncbi:MAG: VCBS repeat-containing protein [Candidatus Eisenbacteria bacterium]